MARLLLDCVRPPGWPHPVRADIAPGGWHPVEGPAADALVDALAGIAPGPGGIVLGGRELSGLPADERSRAGLATATCRLPDLPALRVADVVLLGRPLRRTRAWQVALATRAARTAQQDAEASVRNLGGRLGLAPWLDRDAVALPPPVAALTDTVRALASSPDALVWRRPQWLEPHEIDGLVDVIERERQRLGFTVLEVVQVGAA